MSRKMIDITTLEVVLSGNEISEEKHMLERNFITMRIVMRLLNKFTYKFITTTASYYRLPD